jgi:hypothetical protein
VIVVAIMHERSDHLPPLPEFRLEDKQISLSTGSSCADAMLLLGVLLPHAIGTKALEAAHALKDRTIQIFPKPEWRKPGIVRINGEPAGEVR